MLAQGESLQPSKRLCRVLPILWLTLLFGSSTNGLAPPVSSPAGSRALSAQREVLSRLFTAANGSSWPTATQWSAGTEPCDGIGSEAPRPWHGIRCMSPELPGHVTHISLTNLPALAGTLPSDLRGLASLRTLEIGHAALSGTLPLFGAALERLELGGSRLSGSLPTTLETLERLAHLGLHQMPLSGTLPLELAFLDHLETIQLDRTRLSGALRHRSLTGTPPALTETRLSH